jgi:hypothetical protein
MENIYIVFIECEGWFPWLSGSKAVYNAVLAKAQSRGYARGVHPENNLLAMTTAII